MNAIPMRAYCGDAIFEAMVWPCERGVKEFRASAQEALLDGKTVSLIGDAHEMEKRLTQIVPVLISIPGGKA